MACPVTLEICVDSVEAAVAAAAGGADRLELCAGLVEGGTTPSAGTLELALARVKVPVVVLIRPRRGDFVYSPLEIETMLRDVAFAKRAGAQGVALGALRPDGTIDREATRELARAAQPLPVAFHRAFDFLADPLTSLDVLVSLGVQRVLGAGGAPRLSALVRAAKGRITIVAAGGVRPHNLRALVEQSGVSEVHATARELAESPAMHRPDGLSLDAKELPGPWQHHTTRAELVRALARALE